MTDELVDTTVLPSRRMRLVERYIARAVYNMGIAPSIPEGEFRHVVYCTALRYLKLAIEEMQREAELVTAAVVLADLLV